MTNKIIEYNDIEKLRKKLQKKKIVLVGGCFDILHYGHFVLLRNAAKQGDTLIVELESDEFIKRRKQKVPVHTQMQRAEIVASLSVVDYVVLLPYLQTHDDYRLVVQKIRPKVIAVTEGDSMIEKITEHANLVGAAVKIVTPQFHNFSSSNIVAYESIFSN